MLLPATDAVGHDDKVLLSDPGVFTSFVSFLEVGDVGGSVLNVFMALLTWLGLIRLILFCFDYWMGVKLPIKM